MIVINSKWAVEVDSAKLNYSPLLWEDEKEFRVIKTGEMKMKPAQWIHLGMYFPNMQLTLKEILHQEAKELDSQERQDICEYIQSLNQIVQAFQADCLDKLERRPDL